MNTACFFSVSFSTCLIFLPAYNEDNNVRILLVKTWQNI